MKFYKKDEYAITLIEHVSSVDEVLTACRQSKKQRYFYYQNRRLLVNQQPITQNCQLKQGDELAVRVFIDETIDFLPDSLPLDIVYEDEVLLIVNKPPGLIVHPDQRTVMVPWRMRQCLLSRKRSVTCDPPDSSP